MRSPRHHLDGWCRFRLGDDGGGRILPDDLSNAEPESGSKRDVLDYESSVIVDRAFLALARRAGRRSLPVLEKFCLDEFLGHPPVQWFWKTAVGPLPYEAGAYVQIAQGMLLRQIKKEL